MADVEPKMIISEVLCYIQCKMKSSEHDNVIKSVVSFYREDVIHEAKIVLFEECIETKLRLKTYKIDKAKNDCVDIINKFNEVGSNCPMFVAANLANVPIVSADAYDLAKLSMHIESVLKLENQVASSFEALACLQVDFKTVLQKCSKIDMLSQDIAALKTLVAATNGGQPDPPPQTDNTQSPESDNQSDDKSDAEISNVGSSSCEADVESEAEDRPTTATRKLIHGRPAVEDRSKMTEGGFTYVEKARKHVSNRVFTNSAIKLSQSKKCMFPLQTVSRQRASGQNSGSYISVFVSNFTPNTKAEDVSKFLQEKHQRRLKVYQIPSKFKDCASFKVIVPDSLKSALLDKSNWSRNVYVREFFENSRGSVNLAHN